MIRCLAVDDEPLALELLADNISRVPDLHLVASCSDAGAAIEVLQREAIDLLFLDIRMPGLTGLQLLRSLREPPLTVLTTAYHQYAVEGYELDVADYLMKPYSFERFLQACGRIRDRLAARKPTVAEPEISAPSIFVHSEYSLVRIRLSDIRYVEGLKDYIKIYVLGQTRPILTRMSLKVMEEKLPAAQFVRVHKSFIISANGFSSLRRNRIRVDAADIPVSDTYREALNQFLTRLGSDLHLNGLEDTETAPEDQGAS